MAEEPPNPFNVGLAFSSFAAVNRNDASAAMKTWAISVLKEQNLSVEVHTEIFDDIMAMREKMIKGELDAVLTSPEEFMQLENKPDYVYLTSKQGVFTEQYVLLTQSRGNLNNISDLKDRKFIRHISSKTSLALPWLEILLAKHNLGPVKNFFSEHLTNENPSKVILRVFFKQSDICLVTTNAFEIACEMNPQIRKELKVITHSPPLIPNVFFFRPGGSSKIVNRVEPAIQDLHTKPSGLQVLTVFQGDRVLKQPVFIMEETMQFLKEYEKIKM